jgi:hypothetical protein
VARARLRGTRLTVRGRIVEGLADPATSALVLRVLDGAREVAAYVLPGGSLTARGGRRLVHRDAAGALRRVVLVRRGTTVGIRIAARVAQPEEIPTVATFTLDIGAEGYSGPARIRRSR